VAEKNSSERTCCQSPAALSSPRDRGTTSGTLSWPLAPSKAAAKGATESDSSTDAMPLEAEPTPLEAEAGTRGAPAEVRGALSSEAPRWNVEGKRMRPSCG
jgi:hypothetical protein